MPLRVARHGWDKGFRQTRSPCHPLDFQQGSRRMIRLTMFQLPIAGFKIGAFEFSLCFGASDVSVFRPEERWYCFVAVFVYSICTCAMSTEAIDGSSSTKNKTTKTQKIDDSCRRLSGQRIAIRHHRGEASCGDGFRGCLESFDDCGSGLESISERRHKDDDFKTNNSLLYS